jgi:hypothetical protein
MNRDAKNLYTVDFSSHRMVARRMSKKYARNLFDELWRLDFLAMALPSRS